MYFHLRVCQEDRVDGPFRRASRPAGPGTAGLSRLRRADADTPADGKGQPPKAPAPPASMSTVGGASLGQPGTQVNLLPGAPALPANLTGRSWIVADAETGEVLAAHNAHWRLPRPRP